MGQAQSIEPLAPRSHEQLTKELANKFAEKCFTSLELYSLKDNFRSLADVEHDVRYLKEDTIARFLEIPDILHVSPILFHMMSFIGAFPFFQDAPAVLGLEQMVMVITITTERYRRILARGATDRRKLLFKSLAVYDRKLSEMQKEKEGETAGSEGQADEAGESNAARSHAPGFAVDQAGEDELDDGGDDEDEDDDLVLAAFESLDYIDAFKQAGAQTIHGAMIPADNFRRLIMLLLLTTTLHPQERLSQYSGRCSGVELEGLRSTAECILHAFVDAEKSPGIKFKHFNTILPVSFPFLFGGFNALFEHFLFSKNLDFSKHKDDNDKPLTSALSPELAVPLLQDTGSIMNLNVLSQLSFFIPGSSLFRRLRLLYSGDDDGFSMGSFESKVFNWRAPTILLVRGTRMTDTAHGSQDRFAATLPPKRFPDGSKAEQLTFGLYVSQPWRHTHKECFGDVDSVLFQLEPIHDVLPASTLNKDYVSFIKPSSSSTNAGVAFGNPLPKPSTSYRKSGLISLGAVSLLLDSSFEFGVFTHDYTSRGGAFQNSVARRFNFQDRFEIESLEVWGCGGHEEATIQAERWAWEAREAEARRRINLGTGDIEADRALLEMAGIIGGSRSGGSMN